MAKSSLRKSRHREAVSGCWAARADEIVYNVRVVKFSIVIPVYGTERFLPRCLESLRAQTFRDFEAVVVDDCSPGGCAGVVRPFGDFARYVRHDTNRSAFQARRTGILAAKGDYVVPLDPDDYLLPDLLARVRAVAEREDADMVSYWIDYDDGRRVRPHWCRHPAVTVSGKDALHELAEHKMFTGVASKVVRREVLTRALGTLPSAEDAYVNTCDDLMLLVPSLLLSERVSFLDYAGYRYFVNEESTSHSWRTADGLRLACGQTRVACDAAAAATASLTDDAGARTDVSSIVADVERMFVKEAMAADDVADRLPPLLANFPAKVVAEVLAERLQALRTSRAYRFGNAVAQVPRAVQSFAGAIFGRR